MASYNPVAKLRRGDPIWFNDPYQSGGAITHLPDLAFIAPAFSDRQLLGFCASFGHCWDIGGIRPGSMSPEATEIFQEGVMVPPVRIVREGVWNDEVLRLFLRNSRFPDLMRGDLGAMTAAALLGVGRLTELAERFGREVLLRAFGLLLEQTRHALWAGLHRVVP